MEKELGHKEKIIYATKVPRRSKLLRYLLIIALLSGGTAAFYFGILWPYAPLGLAGTGALILMATEVQLYTRRLVITNQAVTDKQGILSRRIKTVDLEDIMDVSVTQSVFQRALNYGQVHINTAEDDREDEIIVDYIANPMEVKKLIEEIMRKRTYFPDQKGKTHTLHHHPDKGKRGRQEKF